MNHINDTIVVYRDEYIRITDHDRDSVAIQIGDPAEKTTPTIVNAEELQHALNEYLWRQLREEIDD